MTPSCGKNRQDAGGAVLAGVSPAAAHAAHAHRRAAAADHGSAAEGQQALRSWPTKCNGERDQDLARANGEFKVTEGWKAQVIMDTGEKSMLAMRFQARFVGAENW